MTTPHSLALYHLPWLYEPFSALSHLLGAVVFLVLGLQLLRRARGDRTREIFLGIYAFSCVLLLTMSGVYHCTISGGAWNLVLVRLDHGAIFVLIAGTFTPIHGLLFRGPMRWLPLLIIWIAALGGIVLTTTMFNDVPEWVGLTLYLVMGWLGTGGGLLLWQRYGFRFIRPLLLGGIAYSVGAVSEFFRWPVIIPGVVHAHEFFHIAVLVGAALHFSFIWRITDHPYVLARERGVDRQRHGDGPSRDAARNVMSEAPSGDQVVRSA